MFYSSTIEKNYVRKPRRQGYSGIDRDDFEIRPYRELRYIDPAEYLDGYSDKRQEEYAS